MGHVPLLNELALIAAAGVLITLILSKFKLPAVAGLLASGAMIGPFGFGLIKSPESIHMLAEIGVVFLLFTIGLEFSYQRLQHIMKQAALGGFLQVILTILVTMGTCYLLDVPWREGLVYGFVFSLSSTAIVLRALSERRELETPQGRFIMGTLIFQDLCVVPMVLILPFLGSQGVHTSIAWEVFLVLGKALALVSLLFIISRYALPRLLNWVDASRSREMFLLTIIGVCMGTAWLTSLAGLSLALGAFLGGMVVADTQYGHRAMGDILPLRDAFVSIFFISLGMLFNSRTLVDAPDVVAWMLFGFIIVKGLVATLAAMAMRFPARVGWLAGVGLAQFGEFGFILSQMALEHKLLDEAQTSPLLAAGFISMFLTPVLLRLAPHVRAGERLLAPLEKIMGVRRLEDFQLHQSHIKGHVVIVGFGLAGRTVSRSLFACDIPHVVLELDAEIVRKAKREQLQLPIFYADATSEEALSHAHLEGAQLLVLMIDDPLATQRVIRTAQRVAPTLPILTRTRYLRDKSHLLKLGAHEVVAEEVEAALELLTRVMHHLKLKDSVIDETIQTLRDGKHSLL